MRTAKHQPSAARTPPPAHVGHTCGECLHGMPDTKFENLSIGKKPTLVSCPFRTWKQNITEKACEDHYQPKTITN